MRWFLLSVLLLGVMMCGGCGTVVDIVDNDGPNIYGGIRAHFPFKIEGGGHMPQIIPTPVVVAIKIIDIPLCLVADTLLLPISIPKAIFSGGATEEKKEEQKKEEPPKDKEPQEAPKNS